MKSCTLHLICKNLFVTSSYDTEHRGSLILNQFADLVDASDPGAATELKAHFLGEKLDFVNFCSAIAQRPRFGIFSALSPSSGCSCHIPEPADLNSAFWWASDRCSRGTISGACCSARIRQASAPVSHTASRSPCSRTGLPQRPTNAALCGAAATTLA